MSELVYSFFVFLIRIATFSYFFPSFRSSLQRSLARFTETFVHNERRKVSCFFSLFHRIDSSISKIRKQLFIQPNSEVNRDSINELVSVLNYFSKYPIVAAIFKIVLSRARSLEKTAQFFCTFCSMTKKYK